MLTCKRSRSVRTTFARLSLQTNHSQEQETEVSQIMEPKTGPQQPSGSLVWTGRGRVAAVENAYIAAWSRLDATGSIDRAARLAYRS
jgi:hypothetical protein